MLYAHAAAGLTLLDIPGALQLSGLNGFLFISLRYMFWAI